MPISSKLVLVDDFTGARPKARVRCTTLPRTTRSAFSLNPSSLKLHHDDISNDCICKMLNLFFSGFATLFEFVRR